MGTRQSRSMSHIGLRHHKEKRTGYSDGEGRTSGDGGHRYASVDETRKQTVEAEAEKAEKEEVFDSGAASSATQPAQGQAALLSGHSQPKPHGLAGARRADAARTGGDGGSGAGGGPEGHGHADRGRIGVST